MSEDIPPSVPAYEWPKMFPPGHLHFGKCLGIHGVGLPNQAVEAQEVSRHGVDFVIRERLAIIIGIDRRM
jgi:hypothetical protein